MNFIFIFKSGFLMKTLKNWPSKSEKCAPFLLVFFPELSTQLFQSLSYHKVTFGSVLNARL